ncbi:hypothetical protein HZH66_011449 [Vespula vulgaris]|uniref:Uncharacterized protein n=1 Tax=Vespula vulgaris TaxID=7454 RepID=A0A834JH11_VESVU|nr:hypothetical protein HZH66_011449 [Vespula vulgaris]
MVRKKGVKIFSEETKEKKPKCRVITSVTLEKNDNADTDVFPIQQFCDPIFLEEILKTMLRNIMVPKPNGLTTNAH